MWEFTHTITTTAKVESIWKLYSDISSWVKWDKGIVYASLEGDFVAGTRGLLQPEGQERLPFQLTEVEPLQGFSDITDIPGAEIQICFTHTLEIVPEGTSITHKVSIIGPNADILGPEIGAGMAEGIPHTMEGIAALALHMENQHAV